MKIGQRVRTIEVDNEDIKEEYGFDCDDDGENFSMHSRFLGLTAKVLEEESDMYYLELKDSKRIWVYRIEVEEIPVVNHLPEWF